MIADELLKNIENPDSSYTYDGMRFRQSYQKLANNQEWVILRRINARVPTLEDLSVSPTSGQDFAPLGASRRIGFDFGPDGTRQDDDELRLDRRLSAPVRRRGITVEDPVEYVLDGPVGEYGYCYQVQVEGRRLGGAVETRLALDAALSSGRRSA